jgi:DNA-directed RNA polymerase subunit RPC12/RpoP
MNYKSFNLGDWIGHISGVIEDESELDGNEMRDLVEFLTTLNQQPCEDCISRQAVLALPTSKTRTLSGEIIEEEVDIKLIKALPSVTPKEKTGKWESTEIFYGGESKGAIIKCSECGNEFKVSPKVFENLYGNERFCNHCGVRMVSE